MLFRSEKFDVLRTRVIDIQGLNKSTELQVPLELDPVFVDLIGATTITASLDIRVETVQKTISGFMVNVQKDGILQRVTPATVSITAALPKTLIRGQIDLHKLFKVSAEDEQENGQMQVKVMQTSAFSGPYKNHFSSSSVFFAQLDYAKLEADGGVDESGYEVSFGIRSMLSSEFEVKAAIEYLDIDNDDTTSLVFGGAYNFTETMAVYADYKYDSDVSR